MSGKLVRNMQDPESRDFWNRLDAQRERYQNLPDWLKKAASRKPRKLRVTRENSMLYAFGTIYRKRGKKLNLDSIFSKAISEKVAVEDRMRFLTWLRDRGNVAATRYVKSLKDMEYALVLEDFKRRTSLQEKNLERTPPDRTGKPPEYNDTVPGDSVTPDSPGAQMVPRDTSFLHSTRDYLKSARKGTRKTRK